MSDKYQILRKPVETGWLRAGAGVRYVPARKVSKGRRGKNQALTPSPSAQWFFAYAGLAWPGLGLFVSLLFLLLSLPCFDVA